MFGGGGGLDPRKMKQMMKQMGIEVTEIDAEEVVIRTADEDLVFTDADVQRMDAQGQATYQIVGDPESRPRAEGAAEAGSEEATGDVDADAEATDASAIPDADVQIVAQRTGASEEEARAALEAEGGDLAAAVSRLE
ncbi:nascent polypeptide-associated complex protein [Halomarina pelagica]|uniref:nascent polypeptide-associated complex protein n=1 Tax=Halomarina pelagica TaxID=2961599 RepID=UPI0020C26EC0|nr:nascent polypeptide-associated complex protein [Halomarina sp. BND7]